MAKREEREVRTYVNLEPNWARRPELRPQFEEEIKSQLIKDVPAMVSRLAELGPLISSEVGEYAELMMEAERAFMHGFWRAVVALVGCAAEGFTDKLYDRIKQVKSVSGEGVSKEKLFGKDGSVPALRKLTVLKAFGLIDKAAYQKLLRIKKLRDSYVHPQSPDDRKSAPDAQEAMMLFRTVLRERFNAAYTIKEGKIVLRDKPNTKSA